MSRETSFFPVLLGVATEEMRRKILDRLTTEEFWTPYGTRTVSPREPAYDPDFGYQLLGGVWPKFDGVDRLLFQEGRSRSPHRRNGKCLPAERDLAPG